VANVPAGELDFHRLFAAQHAFALLVLDGLIVRRIVVGASAALRLLGPGDVVAAASGSASRLITAGGWYSAGAVRFAVLGRDVLLAAHRAPRLVAGLYARATELSDRLAVQLAICQLPRVEDRVLSMLWLLAESWGQVTAGGTAVRLRLTHETLGGLVGARRSTVTLAMSQLTDEGAIRREDGGWTLLRDPPAFVDPPQPAHQPRLLERIPAHR
jgi:CRP/FNR family transcriptional regulator, cyclic AMP receptor protein